MKKFSGLDISGEFLGEENILKITNSDLFLKPGHPNIDTRKIISFQALKKIDQDTYQNIKVVLGQESNGKIIKLGSDYSRNLKIFNKAIEKIKEYSCGSSLNTEIKCNKDEGTLQFKLLNGKKIAGGDYIFVTDQFNNPPHSVALESILSQFIKMHKNLQDKAESTL